MAELGAVASILQVADVGLRLSATLFTFAETVASADKTVSAVSKDVSLTSSVLRELAKVLDKGHRDEAYSDDAIDSAVAIVKECSDVFVEIDRILIEKLPKLGSQRKEKASKMTIALERFRWPYMQPKMSLLQSSLERLKSSLLVILHVISLARMMKDEPSSAEEGQTALIRDLIKSNQEHVRRYDELRHRITNASTVDAGSKVLVANLQEETNSSGPHECYERELETKLEYTHHFIALFERLEEEVARPSYIIGPQSRKRIQREISNVQERETKCLHRVHGEAAVTKARGNLRLEALLNDEVSTSHPSEVLHQRRRRLSESPSKSISTRPTLPRLSISDTIRDQAPLSMRSGNLTSNSAGPSRSPRPSKSNTSRLSLKGIVDSLRYREKSKPTALDPVADSGHHVDPIKQTSQFATSVVDRTAGSSHDPPGTHAASSGSLPPPVADSRHSLAVISPIRNPQAKHDNDTTHLDTNYRRSFDDMPSPELKYLSDSSETQSSSRFSTSCERPYGSSIPVDDGSGHDVDVGYPSQDKMLDELLRLWTPISIPT